MRRTCCALFSQQLPAAGDASLREQLVVALRPSKDDSEREMLVEALASFRDPALYRKGLELVLDEKLEPISRYGLLFTRRAETRRIGWEFLKANLDPLVNRMPTLAGMDLKMFLPFAGGLLCTTADAQELQQVLGPRLKQVEGAERNLSQTVEDITNCAVQAERNSRDFSAYLARSSRSDVIP